MARKFQDIHDKTSQQNAMNSLISPPRNGRINPDRSGQQQIPGAGTGDDYRENPRRSPPAQRRQFRHRDQGSLRVTRPLAFTREVSGQLSGIYCSMASTIALQSSAHGPSSSWSLALTQSRNHPAN